MVGTEEERDRIGTVKKMKQEEMRSKKRRIRKHAAFFTLQSHKIYVIPGAIPIVQQAELHALHAASPGLTLGISYSLLRTAKSDF